LVEPDARGRAPRRQHRDETIHFYGNACARVSHNRSSDLGPHHLHGFKTAPETLKPYKAAVVPMNICDNPGPQNALPVLSHFLRSSTAVGLSLDPKFLFWTF
jgi:hypothetical protein